MNFIEIRLDNAHPFYVLARHLIFSAPIVLLAIPFGAVHKISSNLLQLSSGKWEQFMDGTQILNEKDPRKRPLIAM